MLEKVTVMNPYRRNEMKLSIRLNESEIKTAIAYWLVQNTRACDNHEVLYSEVFVGTDASGKVYAEAIWEDNDYL